VAASDEEEPMTTALQVPGYPDISIPDRQEWTVEYLASLPKDLRYELIDGRLILPSPTALHQNLGIRVAVALEASCPPELMVATDLSLEINPRNEPRPDVVVLSMENANRSPVPVMDALLAVEIISPDSHFRDMYAKAQVYAAAGIRDYWVIDPFFADGMVLTQYRMAGAGEYEVVTNTNEIFSTRLPYPVTIDLPALTARWRAALERAKSTG
jgi:Uma2 family endonuclease